MKGIVAVVLLILACLAVHAAARPVGKCNPPCANGGVCNVETLQCNCAGTGFNGSSCSDARFCPSDSNAQISWPPCRAGRQCFGTCQPGFVGRVTRKCNLDGVYEPSDDACFNASAACPQDYYGHATFPETPVGTQAYGDCDAGFIGAPVRTCNYDGTWSALLGNHCVQNVCPKLYDATVVFMPTKSLSVAPGACVGGYGGRVTRTCDADGNWGPATGACTQCPTQFLDGVTWVVAPGGSQGVGVCPPGFEGSPTRSCSLDGTWGSSVVGGCTRITCNGTTDDTTVWPSASSGEMIYGTCLPGFVGIPGRSCNLDGSLGSVRNPCVAAPSFCAGGPYGPATFPDTPAGSLAIGTCSVGYVGTPKRVCQSTGDWSSNMLDHCKRVSCGQYTSPAGISFPPRHAGSNHYGQCPAGTVGRPYAYCDLTGSWGIATGGCS